MNQVVNGVVGALFDPAWNALSTWVASGLVRRAPRAEGSVTPGPKGCPVCKATRELWVAGRFLERAQTQEGHQELYIKLAAQCLENAPQQLAASEALSDAEQKLVLGIKALHLRLEEAEPGDLEAIRRNIGDLADTSADMAEGRNMEAAHAER